MNIRSQGVPLKSRYIREDADRFHPRSDGADFKLDCYVDNQGVPIYRAELDAQADDFPIDDEPANEQQQADQELMAGCPDEERLACLDAGRIEFWQNEAMQLAKQLDESRQHYEKNLAHRQDCIEYWQGEVKRLEAELAKLRKSLKEAL